MSRQNSSIEGDEVGIFSKVSIFVFAQGMNWTKSRQPKQGIYIMESSSTFIRIYGPIPKVKTALINDYENIVAYSEQSQQSEV